MCYLKDMKILGIPKVLCFFGALWGATAFACDVTEVSLMNPTGGTPYSLHKMDPRKVSAQGQVIILPPTGGMNFVDRRLGKSLCEKGIPVIILDYAQGNTVTSDFGIHDRESRAFLAGLNETLKTYPNPSVLIGASLGGLYAALAKGLSQKENTLPLSLIKGQVLTVTGGTLPEILATSEHDNVRRQRELRLQTYQIARVEDYLAKLNSAVELELYSLSTENSKDQTLFFGSDSDTIVPGNLQRKLWQKLGEPDGIWFNSSHSWTIGRVYLFHSDLIAQHIFKVLK